MIDHSHTRRRIKRQPLLSREVRIHLVIITSVAAIGGWIATGLLLWMLMHASTSFSHALAAACLLTLYA